MFANLDAGKLEKGEGTLVYRISGVPTSTGLAKFVVVFAGKICEFNVEVEDIKPIVTKPGQNLTDIDGNIYKTVHIGYQLWMIENLKVTKYNDGTDIPYVTDSVLWQSNKTGAWVYYNNDSSYNSKYGKLYNWYSVNPYTNGLKNICPTGWHVPTDADWIELSDYLGGNSLAGGIMKEVGIENWISPNTDASNESLYTGLPGGERDSLGRFYGIGRFGNWWSSDGDKKTANYIGLSNSDGYFFLWRKGKNHANSVRCLKN